MSQNLSSAAVVIGAKTCLQEGWGVVPTVKQHNMCECIMVCVGMTCGDPESIIIGNHALLLLILSCKTVQTDPTGLLT